MKFSDLDKQLDEAPDLSKIKGKLQRAGTKLKQHTPFNKEARLKAKKKVGVQNIALGIKDEYHEWQGETGSEQTLGSFVEFLKASHPSYAPHAEKMAVKLKYKKPEPAKKDNEELSVARPSDSEDPDATGDKSKKVDAPEKEADLELEPEELELEVEEEVDMSASIYESRLQYFLLYEDDNKIKLKDNQLDTLLVRTLQAVKKAGGDIGGSAGKAEKSDEVSKTADKVSKAKAPVDDEEELSVARPSYGKVSSDDIDAIKDRIDEFGDDIKDIIRRQKGVEDSIKKEMSDKIDDLVLDMISNSF
jgi:hypothetical protein